MSPSSSPSPSLLVAGAGVAGEWRSWCAFWRGILEWNWFAGAMRSIDIGLSLPSGGGRTDIILDWIEGGG